MENCTHDSFDSRGRRKATCMRMHTRAFVIDKRGNMQKQSHRNFTLNLLENYSRYAYK